jgi:hypothetical protein
MVDMSCGGMYWRRSDNPPEYSGVRKTCSPNATGDASGSEIELSSTVSGWFSSIVSFVCSDQAGRDGHSGSNHEAQRQRVGVTALHKSTLIADADHESIAYGWSVP